MLSNRKVTGPLMPDIEAREANKPLLDRVKDMMFGPSDLEKWAQEKANRLNEKFSLDGKIFHPRKRKKK